MLHRPEVGGMVEEVVVVAEMVVAEEVLLLLLLQQLIHLQPAALLVPRPVQHWTLVDIS